jgi:hypothetical protein
VLKCPACGSTNNHVDDTDSLGNDVYECDDCGDQFWESDAEWVES